MRCCPCWNARSWTSTAGARASQLLSYYAIGQCTPGVIAVNTATFIGYDQAGVLGGRSGDRRRHHAVAGDYPADSDGAGADCAFAAGRQRICRNPTGGRCIDCLFRDSPVPDHHPPALANRPLRRRLRGGGAAGPVPRMGCAGGGGAGAVVLRPRGQAEGAQGKEGKA